MTLGHKFPETELICFLWLTWKGRNLIVDFSENQNEKMICEQCVVKSLEASEWFGKQRIPSQCQYKLNTVRSDLKIQNTNVI